MLKDHGKLVGLVCVHVDDLLMAGNNIFRQLVVKNLMKHFKFSKLEERKFKYLGCEIEQLPTGDITVNQEEFIKNIKEVDLPTKMNTAKVNEVERREIRRVVGELLWVSMMTRPDLCFEVNRLSTTISHSTVKDLKDAK